MEYEIGNPRLIDLFSKGKSNKYKFLKEAEINKFMKAVAVIEAAEIVTDLWKMQSLKFEHLERNVYSMRLSRQVRLEMQIEWEDEKKQKGFITIKNITKHYE